MINSSSSPLPLPWRARSLSWRAFLPRSRQCEWGFPLSVIFVVICNQRTTDNKPRVLDAQAAFVLPVGLKSRGNFASGAPGRPAALGGVEGHYGSSPTSLVHPVHPGLLAPPPRLTPRTSSGHPGSSAAVGARTGEHAFPFVFRVVPLRKPT